MVDGNDLALVMDLVRGTDLRTRLDRERRLAPEAAVAIVADVADGLAAAHAAGVVHRDVKPENVLLDMQGPLGPGGSHPALLTDFGVAKLIDSPRRTRATKIIGTPDYLAPEIVEGLPPRAAVDIYALATVLYELLAGFTPFGGGHPGAVLRRHVTETVVPLPGHPGRAVAADRPVPGQGARPPGCAPRSWRRGCGSCCRCWRACRRWTWTSRTRSRAEEEADGARGRAAAPRVQPDGGARCRWCRARSRPTPTGTPTRRCGCPAPDELAGGARGTARRPARRGRAPARLGPAPGGDAAAAAHAGGAAVLLAVAGVGMGGHVGDDAGGTQDTRLAPADADRTVAQPVRAHRSTRPVRQPDRPASRGGAGRPALQPGGPRGASGAHPARAGPG